MARILMLVATAVANDSRVVREATTLAAAGHTVHVIGKEVPEDYAPDGFTVSSVGAASPFRSTGGRRLSAPARLARWLLLPRHRNATFSSWARGAVAEARRRDFDVVHAHDFTALEAAAQLAEEQRVPYVYDTHELWLGMQRQYRPTPLQDRREARVERELGGRAAAVITVGEGLAAELRRRYGWTRVVVVRNSFPPAADDPPALETPNGVGYVGRIDGQRELGTVIAAAPRFGIPVRLIGPADESWLAAHRAAIATAGIEVGGQLDLAGATAALRELGVSLVTLTSGHANHAIALPNKLFHAVQAGVPVVASELPELARVVRQYDLGETYRPGDVDGLVAAVRRVVRRYPELVANVRRARPALSWPADARALVALYDGYPWGTPAPDGRPEQPSPEGQ